MQETQFRRWILNEMRDNNGEIRFRNLIVTEWEQLQRMEQDGLIQQVSTERGFLFKLPEQALEASGE